MMTGWQRVEENPVKLALWITVLGVLIGVSAVVGVELLRPVKALALLVGIVILLPTILMKDPRIYWLLMLVTSIPIDIYKSLSRWIAAPEELISLYGNPTAGNASLDFYLTDAVLTLLVVHWLVRITLKLDRVYFPKLAYLFVLYLAWSLVGSLMYAESLLVACLEWCRQLLYFLSFLYVINNVKTQTHVRTVVVALFLSLAIAAGSVLVFAAFNMGTDVKPFDFIFNVSSGSQETSPTMYVVSYKQEGDTKRFQGIFGHPAIAAAYIGLTTPLALAFLAGSRRWLHVAVFAGFVASAYFAAYLTFSRAGMIGLAAGTVALIPIARWIRLLSQEKFLLGIFLILSIAAACSPALISYLETRPISFYGRFDYARVALETFAHNPIFGVGLNNGAPAIKEASTLLAYKDKGAIPCHYLVILVESGIVGFILFYSFFARIGIIGLQSIRSADTESKIILAGLLGGSTSIAVQNLADNPLAGHSISALVWLFAALFIVIARNIRSRRPAPSSQRLALAVLPSSGLSVQGSASGSA